jgi:hypothetical protein
VKNGGTYLVFGVCGPNDRIEVSPFEIYRRDLTIVGSFAIRRTYDRAFKLMEHGRVQVDRLIHEAMRLRVSPNAVAAAAPSAAESCVPRTTRSGPRIAHGLEHDPSWWSPSPPASLFGWAGSSSF